MLDELLGRAELKDRIAELEAETERLERRLEAESERRSEAVRDRQEAQERVNRQEDRIEQLEDRVERLRERDDADDRAFRSVSDHRGRRIDALLARLRSVEAGDEELLTAMVDDEVPDPVAETLGDRVGLVRRAAPSLVVHDEPGVIAAALSPPNPPEPFVAWDDGFRIDPGWFRPEGPHAVALVRSDLFALGEYRDDERVSFEGFESDVMADHSKGGFSQGRFERRRDAQIDEHLDRCADALAERAADRLYVLGERTVLDRFEDDAAVIRAVDASGTPEEALDRAVREFWTTTVYAI